jgi:hypothetical protein
MSAEVASLAKASAAEITSEWLFVSVFPHMVLDATHLECHEFALQTMGSLVPSPGLRISDSINSVALRRIYLSLSTSGLEGVAQGLGADTCVKF